MSHPTDVEIFDQGRVAHHAGHAQDANPYPAGTPENRLWDTGWRKAKTPDESNLLGYPFRLWIEAKRRPKSRH